MGTGKRRGERMGCRSGGRKDRENEKPRRREEYYLNRITKYQERQLAETLVLSVRRKGNETGWLRRRVRERATAMKYSGKLGSRESGLRRATPARGGRGQSEMGVLVLLWLHRSRIRCEFTCESGRREQMGNLSDHTPVLHFLPHRIHISQIYQIALVWLVNK